MEKAKIDINNAVLSEINRTLIAINSIISANNTTLNDFNEAKSVKGLISLIKGSNDVLQLNFETLEWLIKVKYSLSTLKLVEDYFSEYIKENTDPSRLIELASYIESKVCSNDALREFHKHAPVHYGLPIDIRNEIDALLENNKIIVNGNTHLEKGMFDTMCSLAPDLFNQIPNPDVADSFNASTNIEEMRNIALQNALCAKNKLDSSPFLQVALYLTELMLYRKLYQEPTIDNGGENSAK